jgi:glutathione S-transferase
MIKLYNYELSGNCYKLRLLMNILGLPYDAVAIDFYPGKQHKSDDFLEINPFGQLPVLEDGELRLRDAQAILVYLAARYDPDRNWYPSDPATMGRIAMWLATADDITRSASAARLHDAMGYRLDVDKARRGAHDVFRIIDEHLSDMEVIGQHWLAARHPTIADIACFPYIAMSEEGGVTRDDYPAIRRWVERVKRLPGFIGMPGIFAPGL